jgi:mono/diheme cytochrome c family protein
MKGTCMQCKSLCAALAVAAVFACSTAGQAQNAAKVDEAKVKSGLSIWRSSGCSECHGAFADGEKERDEAPTGANLRQTRLDDATIAETIRCGRPGVGMPSFDADAYKQRGCYGQPAGETPDDLYPAGRTLSAQEIGDVVTYLRARIVGKRAVTPEECAFYYGDQASSFCDEAK